MADPDRDLTLDLLAFAPLPTRVAGRSAHQLGVSIFYADLLPRLAARGHRVRVVAERPEEASAAVALPATPGLEVDACSFAYRSGRLPAERRWRDSLRRELEAPLAAALARRRPDRVVIGREILAPVLVEPCRREGIPSVVVAHGVSVAMLERRAHDAQASRALVEALREADLVIAVARHLARSLRALGVERVAVARNGADTARFRPGAKDPQRLAALGIGRDRLVAAQVSGLKASKRPLDVVRAAARVAKDAPAWVHLVVGGGVGRRAVEQAAREQGVLDCFRFTGEVDHEDMPEVMKLADVVVLASEHEGLPLVFGEARACGRVVLASDIPAAREAIRDGETGLLFRMGDPEDLAAKLVLLAKDPALRARLGGQSLAAAQRFTTDDAASAFEAALLDVPAR